MTNLDDQYGPSSRPHSHRSPSPAGWLRRLSLLAAALLLVVVLPACDSTGTNPPEEPTQEGVDAAQQSGPGIHDKFAAVSQQIPDFGGFYINQEGRPVVYLQEPDSSRTEEVRSVLEDVFGEEALTQDDNPRRSQPDGRPLFVEGRYQMEQLLTWYDRLPEVFNVEGVVLIDLNERGNNLNVGVQSLEENGPQVSEKIQQLDIPREAVEIIETELPTPTNHGLRSDIRPTRGGIEIGQAGSNTVCTMGFNASYRGTFGFLTNSHCTNQRGSVTGTRFTNSATGGRIGQEKNDPSYNTCFFGYSCRWSDAAFVDYNSNTGGYSEIARPQSWAGPNSGSSTLKIDHDNPGMTVDGVDAHPVHGQMIDKVGRTSGWTYGFVNRTCFATFVGNGSGGRVKVNGKPVIMRCQYGGTYTSQGGDSGSPVFDWHGDSVTLWGVNWGSGSQGAVFSPWRGITKDL